MKIILAFILLELFFCTDGKDPVRWVVPSDTELDEGEVKILYADISFQTPCQLFLVPDESTATNEDFSLSASIEGTKIPDLDNFFLHPGTATVTLSVAVDGDISETLSLDFSCEAGSDKLTLTIAAASTGSGDPHFIQRIYNHLANKTSLICYDVIGQKNQYIKIFTDSKFKTELSGQLKDDYYMHKIILKINKNLIISDVYNIFLSSHYKINWNDMTEINWIEFENFFYKIKMNKLFLKTNKEDKLTYGIFRKIDDFGKYYLDIAIYGISDDYSGKDGLIGRVGKKEILIYPQIQSNDGERRRTVTIDGFRSVGYEHVRNGESCLLINVNDLLLPSKLNEFLIEN